MANKELLAHVRQDAERNWYKHTLETHLEGTAELAEEFAAVFGNGDWGKAAALLHDLGKGSEKFQRDLKKESGYDAHIETLKGMKNHSTHGAIWAYNNWSQMSIGKILAYLIAGHHAGLPDWNQTSGYLELRLSEEERKKLPHVDDEIIKRMTKSLSPPQTSPCGKRFSDDERDVFHLWIRILYSALVDADFLNTEKFMKEEQSEQRGKYPDLKDLKTCFDVYMKKKIADADPTEVNTLRQQILADCRAKGKERPGFFKLSVPTGGGKTLSSMAFALEHAIAKKKKRIIIAIPYTSIIEQNAEEYKEIFGAENVIEHHSALDPDDEKKEDAKSRLACENWDAPIIVTTNVQLFESLFAARSSRCRKLHNIADSVIILDEAQMLSAEFLEPIVSVMKNLVHHFKVSLVLCTATQPSLVGKIGSGTATFRGLDEKSITEIIRNPTQLTEQFRRVIVTHKGKYNEWQKLADELTQKTQVLCVVNTRSACRELHKCMPKGTIHLSCLMCGEHRSKVIADIKQRLEEKKPVRVISTQLVEAGVDIDFPVVYRALSGFDSIAQAGGRCNREGKLRDENRNLKYGEVFVFEPPKNSIKGLLLKAETAGRDTLSAMPDECATLHPSAFEKYFNLFYSKVSLDKHKIQSLLVDGTRQFAFQFRTAASKFNLIDDQRQVAVIVRYKGKKVNSARLIEQLRDRGPNRKLMRKLQRFTVTIPENEFEIAHTCFESIHGVWCQLTSGSYNEQLGFVG
ncbi:MAG: CRISPR-associated helicase Cas3' [bacterium]|nr:CRISPR-associated helicase Cas3' [bacterium]